MSQVKPLFKNHPFLKLSLLIFLIVSLVLFSLLLISKKKVNPQILESYPTAPANASPALSFNGSSGFIDTKYNESLKTYTLEAWINPTDWGENSFGRIIEKRRGGSEVLSLYLSSTGQLKLIQQFTSSQGRWRTNLKLALNNWYHVAVSYDASNSNNLPSFYINGIKQGIVTEAKPSGTYKTNTDNYLIGNRGAEDRTFNGVIDEVRIWNVRRDASEIQSSMNTEISPSTLGLVSYFRFDEGTGTTTVDSKRNTLSTKPSSVTWTSGYAEKVTTSQETSTQKEISTQQVVELLTNGNFSSCTGIIDNRPTCNPWFVGTTVTLQDTNCASGSCVAISDGGASGHEISQNINNTTAGGTITFWASQWSYPDTDYLYLSIFDRTNPVSLCRWHNPSNPQDFSFPITSTTVYTANIVSTTNNPCPANGVLKIARAENDCGGCRTGRVNIDNVSFVGEQSVPAPTPTPTPTPSPTPPTGSWQYLYLPIVGKNTQ